MFYKSYKRKYVYICHSYLRYLFSPTEHGLCAGKYGTNSMARGEIQYKIYILLVWPWQEILISVTLSANKLTLPFNLVGTYFL